MTKPTPAPTLLVFTLGEECESRRRHLLPATHRPLERRLHRACLDAGRSAGLRLEVSSPVDFRLPGDVRRRRQRGADFGTRLRGALSEAFAEGSGPVVVVGSDVPGLGPEHLRRALSALDEDPERVVIGPSPDGGCYLLAAARPLGGALAGVRWCCRETLASLRWALCREGRSVVLLPPLADLDRRADLERWLATARRRTADAWHRRLARLARLLADLRRPAAAIVRPALRPLPGAGAAPARPAARPPPLTLTPTL